MGGGKGRHRLALVSSSRAAGGIRSQSSAWEDIKFMQVCK